MQTQVSWSIGRKVNSNLHSLVTKSYLLRLIRLVHQLIQQRALWCVQARLKVVLAKIQGLDGESLKSNSTHEIIFWQVAKYDNFFVYITL
jgi:hypothetical protein